MSNKLKIILAIITSVLIISGSAIIFNSTRRNSQISKTELSSSSSSSSTVSSNSSSQVSSVSISSVSVESSSVSVPTSSSISVQASSIKAVQSSILPILSKTVVNDTELEFFSPNNSPKYLTDYLNCLTKNLKDLNGKTTSFGMFVTQNNEMQYFCPPSLTSLECKYNIVYIDKKPIQVAPKSQNGYYLSPYKQGWNCDLNNPINHIPGFMDPCSGNQSERNLEPEGYYPERVNTDTCLFYFNDSKKYDTKSVERKVSEISNILKNQEQPSLKKIIILK